MWDTPTEEYGYRRIPPSLICSPTLSLTLLAPPANANDVLTHNKYYSIQCLSILFMMHRSRSHTEDGWCESVEKTARRKNEDVAESICIENSDTGIVCFYIQDTFQIAKFPWTTQNTQNEERNQRQHNNIIMPSSTLNQGLKEWDWIYERPGWEGFTVSSTYSFVCIINTLQWL